MMRCDVENIRTVIEYCERIEETVEGLSEDDFFDNYMIHSSCAFSIFQIGEAVRRLSIGFSQQHQEINWNELAKIGDILAHRFGDVDLRIVWSVSFELVPDLKRSCISIIEKDGVEPIE